MVQLTLTLPGDIPYHMLSCIAYKAGERKEAMGNAHNVAFVFSGHPMETCLPVGHSELIPLFALLIQVAFGLPIKLYLPQPKSLLTFTLLILSHIPPEQEIYVWFSCWLGLNYNRAQLCSLPETVFGKDYVQRKEEATETERGNEIQIQ